MNGRSLKVFALIFFSIILLGRCASAQKSDEAETEADTALTIFQGVSDRPFLIRAHNVEDDRHMVEVDFKVSRDRDGSPMQFNLPLLYRMNTGDGWEFRLQSSGLSYQNPNLGFSDLSAGFKWNFDPKGAARWSVVGTLEVPSGSAGFAGSSVDPTATLIFEHPISSRWNFVSNLSLGLTKDDPGRDYYGTLGAGAQISYAVGSKTQLNAIVLLNGRDAETNGITTIGAGVGVSRALSKHVQCSFTVGRSFSATGDDYQLITGISRRF
jgi:hypothetical protein